MATRITRKKAEKEAELPKAETPAQEKKAAGLPLNFLKKSAGNSAENQVLLANCEVYTSSEFQSMKERFVKAYEALTKTSAPVVNVTPEALLSFLQDGKFKSFGECGQTKGDPDFEQRLDYTKRTYGYEDLKCCEKYGTIPVEEVNKESPIHGIPLEKRFCSRYGSVQLRLKPEVGSRTSLNVLDSGHQWGLDGSWKTHGFGWLFPVPYRTDKPEGFVGCLMSVPCPNEIAGLKETSPRAERIRESIRLRNEKLLQVLEGKDPRDYVEAHVHGDIVPEDVAEIVFVPGCVKDFPEWKEVEKAAARYNIAVKAFTFIGIDE